MLDLDPAREGPAPAPAATLVLVRDGAEGLEVFCVERNKKSRFLGGAIVFPGGRLDPTDADASWAALGTAPPAPRDELAADEAALRALCVTACRETLEEAALLLATGGVPDADVVALRGAHAADPSSLRRFLQERGLRLDLAALHPLARWVTPRVESRRFDARFFVARAPEGQRGLHDMTETMASFWATPRAVLGRFDRSEVQLAPPTHRTLEVLSGAADAAAALALADATPILPICPELVMQEEAGGQTLALVLPGDPEHSVRSTRVPGASRYVLRGEHWRPSSGRTPDA